MHHKTFAQIEIRYFYLLLVLGLVVVLGGLLAAQQM